MRRFLSKILLFGAVLLILATGLDYVLCRGLLKMEDYRFQDYSAMLDGGMEHDILIMGNSRGKSHFDTALIDSLTGRSSFCIGIGGYPFNVQLAKYRLYRAHNRKPAMIIQNVDHGTFVMMGDVRHQHQSEQFFPLVYDPFGRKELKRLGYGFQELYIPLYRFLGYQQVIKNGLLEALHVKHYVSFPAYKGFRAERGKWNGSVLAQMETAPVVLDGQAKSLFEAFLDQCVADSIRVVLVYSPLYVGAQEKMTDLDKAKGYFQEQADRYGFVYLDYTGCDICRDTSNFCVSVHMNPTATKEFTRMLCRDLDSLATMN